jgi:hypothetical protein
MGTWCAGSAQQELNLQLLNVQQESFTFPAAGGGGERERHESSAKFIADIN